MSVEAITWAFGLDVERSSAKFVLVAMANCANNDMTCWPSVKYLSEATCQDRKTVIGNITRLISDGYILDTGSKKGRTGQIPIYMLNVRQKKPVVDIQSQMLDDADDAEFVCNNSADLGTVKDSQKRNSSENETVPFFPDNSTVFPMKESRFSAETVPKTGHGTVKEPLTEPKGKQSGAELKRGTRLPKDWVLTKKLGEWALEKYPHWTAQTVREVAEKFKDHWIGNGKPMKDWEATFRNWCRNERHPAANARASPARPLSAKDQARQAVLDALTGNGGGQHGRIIDI